MYNDENNQYNPRPRFDPKTGERIHYDDENTTETTQAESSEYRYSAGNIPFEQEKITLPIISRAVHSSRIQPISRQAPGRAV
jgi:hypothetical protein